MSASWTIWLSNGLEANSHYIDSYDKTLRMVQDILDEGDFDLSEIEIEQLETTTQGERK
jgi:hypothetical protein